MRRHHRITAIPNDSRSRYPTEVCKVGAQARAGNEVHSYACSRIRSGVGALRYWTIVDPARSTITPRPAFAITNALFVRDYVGAFMVTLNAAVPLLALESVAEHLTAVRPIGSRLPDFGTQVTGTWPSLASLAVTA